MAASAFTYPDTYGLTWTGSTSVANVTQAVYESLWGYVQPLSPAALARLHLSHAATGRRTARVGTVGVR